MIISIILCIKYLVLFSGLSLIFLIDLRKQEIPDLISIPLIFIGLTINFFLAPTPFVFLGYIFAAVLGYLIIWGLNALAKLYYKKDTIGLGDAKLLALIGAFTGLKTMLFALYFSFIIGGILGLALILLKKYRKTDYLPFGPIIICGLVFYWVLTLTQILLGI